MFDTGRIIGGSEDIAIFGVPLNQVTIGVIAELLIGVVCTYELVKLIDTLLTYLLLLSKKGQKTSDTLTCTEILLVITKASRIDRCTTCAVINSRQSVEFIVTVGCSRDRPLKFLCHLPLLKENSSDPFSCLTPFPVFLYFTIGWIIHKRR